MFNGMMLSGNQVVTKIITISSDFLGGWNLITEAFGGVPPTQRAEVFITVNFNIDINGMNLTGLPDESTIVLINSGNIYGTGGTGGTGKNMDAEDDN